MGFWSSVQHFASSLFEGSQGIHSYPRQQHVPKLGNVFTILFPCLLSSIVMLVLDAWVSRVYSGTGNLGDKHAFMLPKFLWRECGYHFVLNTNSRDAQQIVVQHGCNTIWNSHDGSSISLCVSCPLKSYAVLWNKTCILLADLSTSLRQLV